MSFEHVFRPFTFGPMTVKNRIEMAPTGYNMGLFDGEGTEEMVAYYEGLAKGGAAVVTIGETPIDYRFSNTFRPCLNLGSDRAVHYLFRVNEAVERHGAKLSIEIQHGGRSIRSRDVVIAPSAIHDENEIRAAKAEGRPRKEIIEMDRPMIDEVIESFADAFLRCKRAGMGMAMLHGAHGHLIAQFLSPLANKRRDRYGGSLKNRARFALEILEAIRGKVGKDFAIEYRISADELVPGGMHASETIEFAKMIEGKIDLLHVSAGVCSSRTTMRHMIQPMYMPHCVNVRYARRFRDALAVPVVAVGSIATMEEAEEVLASGQADMVAMARAIMAGENTVNNAKRGKTADTRPCLRCWTCNRHSGSGFPVRCAVNPKLGKEMLLQRIPGRAAMKKAVIIGGGPAGMQAALSAAERGCESTIFERGAVLGGKLVLAAGVEYKQDIRRYLRWLVEQVAKNPAIEVRLDTAASEELVKAQHPDALIIAAGAEPIIPRFQGEELNKVVWFGDVDAGKASIGDKVVLLGGGPSGAETALQLAREGKRVALVDRASEAETKERWIMDLDEELADNGVAFLFEHELDSVNGEGVVLRDSSGREVAVEADAVILSLGFTPNRKTVERFARLVPDTYVIGDCRRVGTVMQAVHDGFNAASLL